MKIGYWRGFPAGYRFASRIASTLRTVSIETRVTRASKERPTANANRRQKTPV